MSGTARVVTWDWRQQPPLADIARAVAELSAGRVHMREVDTGSDQYEWVISDYPVDDAEAERLEEARTVALEELIRARKGTS